MQDFNIKWEGKKIVEYLGKNLKDTYLYTGDFVKWLNNKKVIILRFNEATAGEEKTYSCEAFIQLADGQGWNVDWIPREEIINNLVKV
jgi:hypothetical protein